MLAQIIVLSSFIPMITGSGGNAGSQASVSVIRALSLGEIEFKSLFKANFLKLLSFDLRNYGAKPGEAGSPILIALVVSLTLVGTIIMAKLVGSSLPMLAKKVGFDPAVMANPLITTVCDSLSLLIYFAVATSVLPEI